MQPNIPVTEASETEADLAAHIDAELGLTPPKAEEPAPDETPEEQPAKTPEPETPAEEPAADPGESESTGEEDVTPPTEDEPEAEPDEEVTPPAPSQPATPSDAELSIEVMDADGVTHKISQIEDLPEDFAPKNNRQILEIVSQLGKLDAQREQNAIAAEQRAQEEAVTQARNDQFAAWDAEAAELAKTKRLDTGDSERLDAVFAHMNEINTARIKANNPNLITSLEDALDKFEAKEARDKAAEAKKNDNETAKRKASLIGRSSAAANGDNYVYRAGSARNIDDIPL